MMKAKGQRQKAIAKVEGSGLSGSSSFYLLPFTFCLSRDYRASTIAVSFAFLLFSGCADTKGPTSRPMTAQQRQDAAMRDPFGYGPKQDGSGSDIPSVSGGGVGDFDRKSFDRDLGKMLGN